MLKSDLEKASMEIILHAGNARTDTMEALDKIDDSDVAKALLKSARESIILAHQAQTTVMQQMISEVNEYSILFSHAQDTLMTIMTEVNLAEKLVVIYNKIDEKIKG